MSGAGKAAIYGPEPWATRHRAVWSYWDLWFCVVAIADHDGDLDALAEAIEHQGRTFGGGTAESKLSHLDDLKRRMADAGVDAHALAAGEETEPKTRTKARAKVLKQGLYPRDMTEPMSHTPPRSGCTSGRCAAAGICSRSRPSRTTSGCRTGSVKGSDPRARRSSSRGGWKARSSG